jgi:hypothetical protein
MVRYLVLAMVIGSALAVAAPAPEESKIPPELVKAKMEAARKTYERTWEVEGGSVDVEHVYQWSRRWLEAERQLSDKKSDRSAAAQGHLDRMKALQKRAGDLHKTISISMQQLSATEFYRVEAEIWVLEAKAP